MTPVSGEGKPPYSVPLIVISASTSVPAPKMLPVPGHVGPPLALGFFGIGTALTLRVTTGAAPATAGRASIATARPSKAKRVDALRISFSPLLMGQVRLRSG